jgi:hypothetical protein
MSEENFPNASFEEKMQMIYGKLTERQKRENREQVKFMCREFCGKCPSRQGTGEQGLAFCMEGKSSSISEKKGCLCKTCPISKTMSLRWEYYCINGSAIELSQSVK